MWSRWQCLLSCGTWHERIVHVGAVQAGIIASSFWNPYISCLKTQTLNHYPTIILCTFLNEIYGMFCVRFIFLMLLFPPFFSSLHNLFYFKCRHSLILHYCVVINYVETKRLKWYSISLWRQNSENHVLVYICLCGCFYIYSICMHLNLLFAPWMSVL